jgi:hypothetical protein
MIFTDATGRYLIAVTSFGAFPSTATAWHYATAVGLS